MSVVSVLVQKVTLGKRAHDLRISLRLTQEKLAELAGLNPEEVVLFEYSLPVRLDARRRILQVLWATKAGTRKTD